jgi:hypothetical protein
MKMKVKAKQLGYYDHKRRQEGVVFDLLDKKHFSKKWMEWVDDDSVEVEHVKPSARPRKKDVVEAVTE